MNIIITNSIKNVLLIATIILLLPVYICKAVDNYFFDEDAAPIDRALFYGSYATMFIIVGILARIVYFAY